MYIVLAVVLLGIINVCVFILGGIFSRHLMMDVLDEARRQRQSEEYYRISGYQRVGDPKPYIPPTLRPRAPRARMLPHMDALCRVLKEGKRGTIMVRAGDRRKETR